MARDHFAGVLGVARARVHVIVRDVGGAFGQKINVGPRGDRARARRAVLGRPVKWIEDRRENLVAAPHARAARKRKSRIALDDDGTILASQVDHVADVGAVPGARAAAPDRCGVFTGPYRIAKAGGSSTSVRTNTMRRGAYRGPWMFETDRARGDRRHRRATYRLDPLELRRRNLCSSADLPYTTAAGIAFDRVTPAETLEQAADDARLRRRSAREQAAARADGRLLGIGIACYVEPTASGSASASPRPPPSASTRAARSQVLTRRELAGAQRRDHAWRRSPPSTSASTSTTSPCCQGDTAVSPIGASTGGSRNASSAAPARQAALEMREQVLEIAAHTMEASPDDLDIERRRRLGAGHAERRHDDARRGRAARVHRPDAAARRACRRGSRSPHALHHRRAHVSNAAHICTVRGRPATPASSRCSATSSARTAAS